jgi:predicted  nucleic acid-binding Zn-ribbon protein
MIEGIWEEIGDLKSKVDNIEDKVQNIEDKVQDIKDKLISVDDKSDKQYNHLLAEIGDLESKVNSLEVKFDKVMFEQGGLGVEAAEWSCQPALLASPASWDELHRCRRKASP